MGAVYEARDIELGGSPVAIKQTLLQSEQFGLALQREAILLANLFHPALPRVRDQFKNEDGLFLVMDLVPGEDLATLFQRTRMRFPVGTVVRWADQLLDALNYLHSHTPPIIHRDIKPQNIKLTPNGQVVLLDFGLAKGGVGNTTSIAGSTLAFAPPEQIAGRGTGPASDLYSLAATVYTLLAGTLPADAMTRMEAKANGRLDPLLPLYAVVPEISRELSDAIMSALQLDETGRTRSAAEMRAVIVRSPVAANAVTEAMPIPQIFVSSPPATAPPAVQTSPNQPATTPMVETAFAKGQTNPTMPPSVVVEPAPVSVAEPPPARRRVWPAIAAVVCAVILGGAAVTAYVTSQPAVPAAKPASPTPNGPMAQPPKPTPSAPVAAETPPPAEETKEPEPQKPEPQKEPESRGSAPAADAKRPDQKTATRPRAEKQQQPKKRGGFVNGAGY